MIPSVISLQNEDRFVKIYCRLGYYSVPITFSNMFILGDDKWSKKQLPGAIKPFASKIQIRKKRKIEKEIRLLKKEMDILEEWKGWKRRM